MWNLSVPICTLRSSVKPGRVLWQSEQPNVFELCYYTYCSQNHQMHLSCAITPTVLFLVFSWKFESFNAGTIQVSTAALKRKKKQNKKHKDFQRFYSLDRNQGSQPHATRLVLHCRWRHRQQQRRLRWDLEKAPTWLSADIPFPWDRKLLSCTGKHDCASSNFQTTTAIRDSNMAQLGLALERGNVPQCFDFIFYTDILLSVLPYSRKVSTHCGGGGASWQSSWFIPHLQYKYKTEQATWGWLLKGPFSLTNSSCKKWSPAKSYLFASYMQTDALCLRNTRVALWLLSMELVKRLFKRLKSLRMDKDLNMEEINNSAGLSEHLDSSFEGWRGFVFPLLSLDIYREDIACLVFPRSMQNSICNQIQQNYELLVGFRCW